LRDTAASGEIWRWHEEAHLADGLRRSTRDRPSVPLSVERRLLRAAIAGDAAARGRLIDLFLPSVAGVARRYRTSSAVDRNELMQAGVMGLLRALERYDPQRGTPFWAYAAWWVREAMQQVVAELARPVILSDRALRQLARIKGARLVYLQEHAREPTSADLADVTGLSCDHVDRLIAADRPSRGLAEPLGRDDEASATVGELLADPAAEEAYQALFRRLEAEGLRTVAVDLAHRERAVLRARYGMGCGEHTLQEIATGLGVSAERVRQIEQQALHKLRAAAEAPSRRRRGSSGIDGPRAHVPRADVVSGETEDVVRLDLPGITADMLRMRLERSVITIAAERRRPPAADGACALERPFGRFERAISVPAGVGPDAIDVSLEAGVLTVRIPAPPPG
jgi:RNA polymerase sigma factor (sigma-70 family)